MALMFGCYFKFGAGPKARSGASGSGGPTAKRVNSERSPGFSAPVGLIVLDCTHLLCDVTNFQHFVR